MTRRRQRRDETHLCLTQGCGARIEGWQHLCGGCLRRLPWARRRALIDAPRHQKQGRAIEAAAWLEANPPGAQAARMMGERLDEVAPDG